jgi:hypothetical protein
MAVRDQAAGGTIPADYAAHLQLEHLEIEGGDMGYTFFVVRVLDGNRGEIDFAKIGNIEHVPVSRSRKRTRHLVHQ